MHLFFPSLLCHFVGECFRSRAPSVVPDRGHDAFWAAVARGLVGSGYEIKRHVATNYSRSRWIGPIGGTS